MHRAEPSAVQGILEGLTGFYRSRSTRPHRAFRRMSRPVSDRQPRPTRRWSLDPDRPVTNGGSREVQSGLLLRHRLARFMDLLPVGCELQRLVVLRERFLPAALLRQQVGPPLERISAPQPVRVAPTHARAQADVIQPIGRGYHSCILGLRGDQLGWRIDPSPPRTWFPARAADKSGSEET